MTKMIYLMPLLKNIPQGKEGWELKTCPKCGQKCWETSTAKTKAIPRGWKGLCTTCGLKANMEYEKEQGNKIYQAACPKCGQVHQFTKNVAQAEPTGTCMECLEFMKVVYSSATDSIECVEWIKYRESLIEGDAHD